MLSGDNKQVVQEVAKEIGIDSAELERISTENARRFYFKIKN